MNKFAHFLAIKDSYSSKYYANLYLRGMVRLHGLPFSIISDCGTQLTSLFCKTLQKGFATMVKIRTTFHLQKDGQTYHTTKTLKDMLMS